MVLTEHQGDTALCSHQAYQWEVLQYIQYTRDKTATSKISHISMADRHPHNNILHNMEVLQVFKELWDKTVMNKIVPINMEDILHHNNLTHHKDGKITKDQKATQSIETQDISSTVHATFSAGSL